MKTALDQLSRAIAYRESADAYVERSQVQLQLGLLDEAIDDMRKASELEVDNAEYIGQAGFLHLQRAMRSMAQDSTDRNAMTEDLEKAVEQFGKFLDRKSVV